MIRIFCILSCLLLPPYLFSEEKKYGSLVYNSDIPNTLFLTGNIRNGDSFSLRKALRNHEISTIVLASPGGRVMEGLNMAGIIFDKGLNVYVPEMAICASSCAFMFFAGKERKVRGKLGVHQFYSGNASASGNINETENVVQFTVSEIIGFLNEFNTPRFVFERMFQQQEMYFFNQEELDQLMTTSFSVSETTQVSINRYLEAKKKVIAQKEPEITKEEVVALLQKQLNEIGCNAGPVDGKYGSRTDNAIRRFAKKAGLPYRDLSSLTDKFIDSLLKAPKDFCPEYVGWPYLSFATRYNAYCKTTKGTRANTNSHCQGNSGYYSKISYNPNNNLMTSIYTNCNGISFRVIMKMKKNGSFIEDGTSQNKRYYFDKSGFVYKFEDSLSYGQGHRYVCTMRP